MRDLAVEAKEEGRIVFDCGPHEAATLVQSGGAIVPREQARVGAACECGDLLGESAKGIGAVEARPGEEGIRQ